MRRRRPRNDPRRGRHKRRGSPETRRWVATFAEPLQPGWCDADTWAKLGALKRRLEGEA